AQASLRRGRGAGAGPHRGGGARGRRGDVRAARRERRPPGLRVDLPAARGVHHLHPHARRDEPPRGPAPLRAGGHPGGRGRARRRGDRGADRREHLPRAQGRPDPRDRRAYRGGVRRRAAGRPGRADVVQGGGPQVREPGAGRGHRQRRHRRGRARPPGDQPVGLRRRAHARGDDVAARGHPAAAPLGGDQPAARAVRQARVHGRAPPVLHMPGAGAVPAGGSDLAPL
ncbi:MAG: Endonuclease III, partial [uncultured Gemmatimonadaceae bacterium]